MLYPYPFYRWLRQGVALALLGILAACGSSITPPPAASEYGYLLTVKISDTDAQQTVAQKYDGEVIAWHPDAGFAILQMTNQAVAQLTSRGVSLQGTTLSTNSTTAAPEVSAAGWSAWGGGWNAWAGGWNAWAGGWNAWAGGLDKIPAIPGENRYAFKQTAAPQAQAIVSKFGDGTKVAVIDTGLDLAHPMFTGRLAASTEWKDFVDGDTTPQDVSGGTAYGHGTVVAGIIAQIAPKATILPIRVLGADGSADVNNVIAAIDWAVQKGANIINLSLGTTTDVAALKTEVEYATGKGIYVVASAGNDGSTTKLTYPAEYATSAANYQYLVSVGSSDSSSTLSSFSNRDINLEIVTRGEGIFSAYPGSQIAYATGTSFAAPQVSGALALARSNTASANYALLGNILTNSSWLLSGYTGTAARYLDLKVFMTSLPDFVPTRQVLFVVGNTTLNTGDATVRDELTGLGYKVVIKSGLAVTSADATGKALVVVSSTVASADVNTKFKSVTTPVLTWESAIYDDLGMVSSTTGSYGTATGQNSITIPLLAFLHPLSANLFTTTLGTGQVFSSSGTMSWGKPPSTAITIATLPSDSTKAVIFAYDTGAQMVGMTAPGRRVAFMFDDNSSTYASDISGYWTSNWLFESAVTWAVTGN